MYLNPIIDSTFWKVFKNKELAISLLNTFLPFQIEEIEYLTPEQIPSNPAKRYLDLGVKCIDDKGQSLIVEMQTDWNQTCLILNLFKEAKKYTEQQGDAVKCDKFRNIYSLSFIHDKFFSDYKHENGYMQEYFLANNNKEGINEEIGLIFVELPKYKPVNSEDKKMKDLWLEFFTEINEATKEPNQDLLQNPIIAKAIELLRKSTYTDGELEWYFDSKANGIFTTMSYENIIENHKKEVAKILKSKNYDNKVIAEVTGLSEKEVEKP